MNLNNVLVSAVAALVVSVVVVTLVAPQDGADGRDGAVGAAAGPDVTESTFFQAGASYAGGCFSTTTSGTIKISDMDNGCIDIAPSGGSQAVLSLTLPTATALNNRFFPRVGMCRDWVIDASDVVAATTTTIVANTGIDVVGLDATGAGTGADVIDGAEFGKLTLCRQQGDGVTAYVEEWIAAD